MVWIQYLYLGTIIKRFQTGRTPVSKENIFETNKNRTIIIAFYTQLDEND